MEKIKFHPSYRRDLLRLCIIATILLMATIWSAAAPAQDKYHHYEQILGEENPMVSQITGDSVSIYLRADSATSLLTTVTAHEKILADLRVINRNQATLEKWLVIISILSGICVIMILARGKPIRF